VSWEDAIEFCARLSRHTGKNYRLPSEAEWEYACRAGTKTSFYFGETISTDQANYKGNDIVGKEKKGVYRQKTTPVGSFSANKFGLYDLHGNVWEWCEDGWHENYQNAPKDCSAWNDNHSQTNRRVLRGGSWNAALGVCRSACRFFNGSRNTTFGFRVVSPQDS
jgi:formylglycine-generating enzyme required for sulfatase activity